ncbi:MAG: DUF4173 domain-containing protein [Anaerolineaceae bacterium]
MRTKNSILVVTGLVLAWAVDYFFWGKMPGLAFPIWITAAALSLLVLAIAHKRRIPIASGILLVLSVGLSTIVFFRDEPLTRFIAAALSLGSLSLAAANFLWGDWLQYAFRDYVVVYAKLIAGVLSKPFTALSGAREEIGDGVQRRKGFVKRFSPILVGFLIAIPVLLILTLLLVSADLVFSNQVEHILSFLDIKKLPEYIFRLVIILVLAFIFIGTLLHALEKPDPQKAMKTGKPVISPFFGWIEGSVVLVLVNILFIAFVTIQVRYLFGGQANITETGFTYSEYARKGFNELVLVTIFSLLVYLALASVSKFSQRWQKGIFTALSLLLFSLVLVILASAFQRLHLYEEAYGLTRLRTFTHFFIFWMAALLVGSAFLEVFNERRRFALLLVVFAAGYSITLGVVNVDGYIVQRNVERAQEEASIDFAYLNTLSNGAVPGMVSRYQDPALEKSIHDGLGAELACRTYNLQHEENQPWQSLTLPRLRSAKLLEENLSLLDTYPVMEKSDGLYVKIQNDWKPCNAYDAWMD